MVELLERVLDAANDIDHALELGDRLGWRLLRVDASSGANWVMMQGAVGPCVSLLWVKPEIRQMARYSNATFRSLYGAVVIALLRGLAGERQMDEDVKAFAPSDIIRYRPISTQ